MFKMLSLIIFVGLISACDQSPKYTPDIQECINYKTVGLTAPYLLKRTLADYEEKIGQEYMGPFLTQLEKIAKSYNFYQDRFCEAGELDNEYKDCDVIITKADLNFLRSYKEFAYVEAVEECFSSKYGNRVVGGEDWRRITNSYGITTNEMLILYPWNREPDVDYKIIAIDQIERERVNICNLGVYHPSLKYQEKIDSDIQNLTKCRKGDTLRFRRDEDEVFFQDYHRICLPGTLQALPYDTFDSYICSYTGNIREFPDYGGYLARKKEKYLKGKE